LAKRDAPVVAVMRELAAQYPRYEYRRIQVFLGRRGHVMSADRTHRLWRRHGLQVPRKRPRRRVSRIDAKILIEEFRRQFNEVRPHSSLGQLMPVEFEQQLLTTDPNTAVSKVFRSEESRQVSTLLVFQLRKG
jgi:transposase InsO family protein